MLVMIKAKNARDLPRAIFKPPYVYEFRFPAGSGIRLIRMRKAVDADLDRSIILDGIDLERSGNQLAMNFATDIAAYGINKALPACGKTSLIMVELQVL